MLQETHSTKDLEDMWRHEWGGKIYFSHGTSESRGVAILLSPQLDINILEVIGDDEGRFVAFKTESTVGEDLLLCNVYAPTRNNVGLQQEFLGKMKIKIANIEYVHLILGGDWNTIFDPKLDKFGGDMNYCVSKYTEDLLIFMETFDLVDIIRHLHPEKKLYTRFQRNPLVMSRIDHFLISSQLCNLVKSAYIHPGVKSDHSLIDLHLIESKISRGKGFWKFNMQLLKDKEYVESIKSLIADLKLNTVDILDKGIRCKM